MIATTDLVDAQIAAHRAFAEDNSPVLPPGAAVRNIDSNAPASVLESMREQ